MICVEKSNRKSLHSPIISSTQKAFRRLIQRLACGVIKIFHIREEEILPAQIHTFEIGILEVGGKDEHIF